MANRRYEHALSAVEQLRDTVLEVAQCSTFHFAKYGDIRLELLKDREFAPLVPPFVTGSRSHDYLNGELVSVPGSVEFRRWLVC